MENNNSSPTIHIMCTQQVHTCGLTSDKQIESVSGSLSASANYLRKLVLGNTKKPPEPEVVEVEDQTEVDQTKDPNDPKDPPPKKGPDSTVSVHADCSFSDALIGFTDFDSKDVDTDAYKAKRQAYEDVRQTYPDVDNLIRDEKVKALKALKQVGFRYYTIQVTAFIKKDGLTRTVCSKSHHRLEMPSEEYLKDILQKTFNGIIRSNSSKND